VQPGEDILDHVLGRWLIADQQQRQANQLGMVPDEHGGQIGRSSPLRRLVRR
jgi:hypothetical protein